jgi:hypothetical protein
MGGNTSADINGNSDTIALTSNSGSNIVLDGGNEVVTSNNGSDSVGLIGADSTATITGTGAVNLNSSQESVTMDSSGATVGVATDATADTINAAGDTVELGGGSTANINGNSDTVDLGTSSSATVTGTAETINATSDTVDLGAGSVATIYGNNDTVDMTASSASTAAVDGTGDVVAGNTGSDQVGLVGVGTTATVSGNGQVGLNASDESVTLTSSGATAVTAGSVTSESISGSSDTVDLGSGSIGTVIGNSDTVNMVASSASIAAVDGTGDVVTGNIGSDQIGLVGVGTTATVSGNGYIGLNQSDESVTLTNSGVTVGTVGDVTSESISGSSDTVDLGSGSIGTVIGNSDTVNMVASSASIAAVDGTGDVVTGNIGSDQVGLVGVGTTATVSGTGYIGLNQSDESVTLTNSGVTVGTVGDVTSESISGSSDTVDLGSGSIGTVIGNSDTVNMVASSASTAAVDGTGDVVTGNIGSDQVGLVGVGTTATVSGTGYIGLNQSDESVTLTSSGVTVGTVSDVTSESISGAGETIDVGADSSATVVGNSEVVNLVTDSSTMVTGTGETIEGSNDAIGLGANTSVGVVGSGDSISVDGSGDGITASHDSINIGNGLSEVIAGSNDSVDLGTSSAISITGAGDSIDLNGGSDSITATDETIIVGANTAVTVNGSGDTIQVDGSGDTIDASHDTVDIASGDTATIDGTYDDATGTVTWEGSTTGDDDDGNPVGDSDGDGDGDGSGSCSSSEPLVIGLSSRDGVNLLPPGQSSVLFSSPSSATPTSMGWVGADAGILTSTANGSITLIKTFKDLAALAPAGSNVIDASDPAFAGIRLWVDGNNNGPGNSGELLSLASLGITSISLASSPVSENIDGNKISAMGWLTFADGSVEPVYDVTFGHPNGTLIYAGTTVELGEPSDQQINFAAATGTLKLDGSSNFTGFDGQISGFNGEDRIDLAGVAFGASTTLAYSANSAGSGGTLMVSDGTDTASLALLGQYGAADFAISSDGHGGTLITDPLAATSTVANGASVEIDGASAANVTFAGNTGTLKLDNSSAFTGAISGMAGKDTLDLGDISYGPATTSSFIGDSYEGILTITNGTDTVDITLLGNYSNATWSLTGDGDGGTSVVEQQSQVSSPNTSVGGLTVPTPGPSNGGTSAGITATMPNTGPSASNALVGVTTAVPDPGPSGGDAFAGVTNPGPSSGATVAGITAHSPDMLQPVTWQQSVALMGNYMASSFVSPAFNDSSGSDPAAFQLPSGQGFIAPQPAITAHPM